MNRIDASDHYEVTATGQTPSLLTIILDTNPRAWQALGPTLSISAALANILVFVNAHLAFGNDNQVAILAAHSHRAVWLYPKPPGASDDSSKNALSSFKKKAGLGGDGDIEMTGVNGNGNHKTSAATSANKYPQFAAIESSILSSLQSLIAETDASSIPYTTLVAGALTTALSYINKTALSFAPAKPSATDPATGNNNNNNGGSGGAAAVAAAAGGAQQAPTLHARILVLSVSDSEPAQYIATMNAVFAAAHARIPIDTLSLSPHASPTFLQQAAFITGGSYVSASLNPPRPPDLPHARLPPRRRGPRPPAPGHPGPRRLPRRLLLPPRRRRHRLRLQRLPLHLLRGPPGDAGCLTCGTRLALGNYGNKPAVVPRKKKKKKRVNGVSGREETGSATGTPVP
ncbi:hypothetical protein PG993_006931 [Apiospora rasikravindrae]|uniref:General transcription and DNA repair factor IIH subunit TFB4 n=1 Tax=Apiospora rasikravindrae TaxID=990691 RepID=A0ABR1SW18_9PEZI